MGDINLTLASCLRSVSGAEILSPEDDTFNRARGVPVRAFYLGVGLPKTEASKRSETRPVTAACEGVAHVRRPKAKPKTEAPSPGKRENKERNPEQREWVVDQYVGMLIKSTVRTKE